ncbi:hypothetical protein FE784_39900 [Paenibacillus hemerocallicola]|uniref:Uncharacterized protein n=1 Tax=Paenibacillus hemerocallicola TaxID=1172614 RepID=A0A5C4SXF9_9BACL|nr:hypothetical protein [Paenibacillus hemerocallicola]TNJ54506.1 hypothetical protein FE784_39900 [Paenibacillus hemerocallicola]
MMDNDKEPVKARLDEELRDLRFQGAANVLARTHPRTWAERIRAIWNKEIEIPVVPSGAAVAVLLLMLAIQQTANPDPEQAAPRNRQLVEAGGNTYWKDEFERAVANAENQNQG